MSIEKRNRISYVTMRLCWIDVEGLVSTGIATWGFRIQCWKEEIKIASVDAFGCRTECKTHFFLRVLWLCI